MARLKVAKELITDDKLRSQKYAKRKPSVIKKITELTTLCDIRVGLILYEKGNSDNSPEIYPEDPQAIEDLIKEYKAQPIAISERWNSNLSTVVKSWQMKAENDITKLQESMEVKGPTSPLLSNPCFDCINLDFLSELQLAEYAELIGKQIEIVNKAYECKKNQEKMVGETATSSRLTENVGIATQEVAQPIQNFDNVNYSLPPLPPMLQIPAPIAVQQTIINHNCHPMQSLQYNMQVGALYQPQSIMPFVYPQNFSSLPAPYQLNETSSFNDGFYNQMDPSGSASSLSSLYDQNQLHNEVGQYSMLYPPANPTPPMLPSMNYYPGMQSNADLANWQMRYSSEGNFGP